MAKIVSYNGDTISSRGSSDPGRLVLGGQYEVIDKIDHGWQTNYILKGIEGEFNTTWFIEVHSS